MSNITTTEALVHLLPNVEFTLIDDSYDSIAWLNEPASKPTHADIEAAKKFLEQDVINKATEKAAAKAALLEKLGITEDEAKLLLG